MKPYIVLYVEDYEALAFDCQADDADHAEEQCLNAWPNCSVVHIVQTDDVNVAFDNYWNPE
jgi:hypothetical protein